MAKYVNADALKWVANQYQKSGHLSKEAALNLVKAAIDAAPNDATDAVEIHRCKECRFWKDYGTHGREWGVCHLLQKNRGSGDFCSRGERREDHAAD